LSRGAYVGAINRAKFAIENYDGAPVIRDALAIMVDAYNKLGMQDLAKDTQRVLEQNYSAGEVKEAEKKSWWKFW
jgi:outer membrane protein assembly factor BamD